MFKEFLAMPSQERQLPREFSFIFFTSRVALSPPSVPPIPSPQLTSCDFSNVLEYTAWIYRGIRNCPCFPLGPAPIITGLCLARKYFCIWEAPPGTATTSPGQGFKPIDSQLYRETPRDPLAVSPNQFTHHSRDGGVG